jgi:hypothetical protein
MSKEPLGIRTASSQHLRAEPAAAAAAAAGGDRTMPYVTAQNFHTAVESRVKPLPPGADATKSPATLYQLREHVEFRCTTCRRDRIRDDAIAVDAHSGRLTCQRCFARIVRPRAFKPTRLVPFPSLLSWLNFGASNAANAASSGAATTGADGGAGGNGLQRMAEAVIPSDARMRGPGLDGSGANGPVGLLPATPLAGMQNAAVAAAVAVAHASRLASASTGGAGAQSASAAAAVATLQGRQHPCESVFGHKCAHGATCYLLRAPATLDLEFLMGLRFDASASDGREQQRVFDLPPPETHPERWRIEADAASQSSTGDSATAAVVVTETPDFRAWVAARRSSTNIVEWQLWNQPGALALVDRALPAPRVLAPPPSGVAQPVAADAAGTGALNAATVESMLRGLKKSAVAAPPPQAPADAAP